MLSHTLRIGRRAGLSQGFGVFRDDHGILSSVGATVRRNFQTDYDSVQDFTEVLREQAKNDPSYFNKRYVTQNQGWNVWNTQNPEIKQILQESFKDIVDGFAIDAPVHPSASENKIKKTYIVSDDEMKLHDRNYANISKQIPRHISVCSGGISALFSTYLMSTLYKELINEGLIDKDKVLPPVYVRPSDIKRSASKGSSGQYHVSHAEPMYTDPEFSTANILLQTVKRATWGVDPKTDNYMIGEISLQALLTDRKVMQVGLGYLMNEMQYKYNKMRDLPTICDETIPLAIHSGVIMDQIDAELSEPRKERAIKERDALLKQGGSEEKGKQLLAESEIPLLIRNDTIRVAYNEAETKEMEETQRKMKKYGIECLQISPEDAREMSSTAPITGPGGTIWQVKGDGNLNPDVFDLMCEAITRNEGLVVDGMVSTILHDKKSKKLTGVVVDCGINDNGIPTEVVYKANSCYTSFGVNAEYVANNGVKLDKSIEPIIPATGYSAYLLVEGEIKRPIDSNNSHFTPFASRATKDGKIYTIVKTTTGGAIGTDRFNIDHAENNLHYAREIIFPGRGVEIITARSCSRPINYKNSGRLEEVLDGNFVATGFGGKGITDGAAFAYDYVKRIIEKGKHGSDLEKKTQYEAVESSFAAKYLPKNRQVSHATSHVEAVIESVEDRGR